jgi:ABC-type branched-subunit amino acid transport system substrate-binding protein
VVWVILCLLPACGIFTSPKSEQPAEEEREAPTEAEKPGERDTVVIDTPVVKPDTLTLFDSLYPPVLKDTYRVALLLPVFDSVAVRDPRNKQIRQAAIDYYQGIRMAGDTMAYCGKQMVFELYDTRNDSFYAGLAREALRKNPPDLVIGPLFSRYMRMMRALSQSRQLTFISPIVDVYSLLDSSHYLVSMNPPRQRYGRALAQLVNQCFEDCRVAIFNEATPESQNVHDSFRRHLDTSRHNIILDGYFDDKRYSLNDTDTLVQFQDTTLLVLTSETESFVNAMLNRFTAWNDTHAVAIGLPALKEYQSLEPQAMERFHLHLITPYHVDYAHPATDQFVRAFRKRYHDEPNAYHFRGFGHGVWLARWLHRYGVYFQNQVSTLPARPTHFGGLRLKAKRPGGFFNTHFQYVAFRNFRYQVVGADTTTGSARPRR